MTDKKAVLIIDESLAIIQLYKGLLAAYDCIVHAVSDVEEAIEKMVYYEYELYVMDTKIESEKKGIDLIGKAGADADKFLIISNSLTEEDISRLTDYYGVPRSMIMSKPPDVKAFAAIADEHLSPDSDKTEEEKKDKDSKWKRTKKWFGELTFRGWLALIGVIVILPTTFQTTAAYIKYKQYKDFNEEKVNYGKDRFANFVEGENVTKNTYKEEVLKTEEAKYIIRFYPDYIIHIEAIPFEDDKKVRNNWIIGKEYLETIGLTKDITLADILRSAIGQQ